MLFLVGTVSSEPESYSEQLVMITKKTDKFSFIARESVLDTMGGMSLLMSLGCSQGVWVRSVCVREREREKVYSK